MNIDSDDASKNSDLSDSDRNGASKNSDLSDSESNDASDLPILENADETTFEKSVGHSLKQSRRHLKTNQRHYK